MKEESSPNRRGFVEAPDGGREQLDSTVAALRRPSSYPEDVGGVEAIETHMSWVFLTEAHAYKLKKPIRTSFFDHTTAEARRRACHTEVELNRRLAESVYLEVAALVEADGQLSVETNEKDGRPVDWLVKMRRLSAELMLEARIEGNLVEEAEIGRLSEKLATFYAETESVPREGEVYRGELTTDIEAKRASLERPIYGLTRADVHAVAVGQKRWIDRHEDLLDARGAKVVHAHGDLRPEHVCLEREPVIIDCLEFDRSLRLLDPVSELSFLMLECRRLGAAWIGERLLEDYQDGADDPVPASLIMFYQSYHALVRAAVAVWHLNDETVAEPEKWRDKGRRYLKLARQTLGPAVTPR